MTGQAPGRLTVEGPYEFTFLEVLDADRRRVASDVERLDEELSPGAYVVRGRVGDDESEQLVRVRAGATVPVKFDALEAQLPLPALADGSALPEPSTARVADPGTGSSIALFVELGDAELPHVRILDAAERPLADVDEVAAGGALANIHVPVAPGTFALEYDLLDGARRRQPLFAAAGHETQAFVSRRRDRGPLVKVYMCPLSDGPSLQDPCWYAVIDGALNGLLEATRVLPHAASSLLDDGGLADRDPMLALVGAWATLEAGDIDRADRACVSLERHLPDCPDTRALRLVLGGVDDTPRPIGAPPLLAVATSSLLARADATPGVIEPGSWLAHIVPRLRTGGPWTLWDAAISWDNARSEVVGAILSARRSRAWDRNVQVDGLPAEVTSEVDVPRLAALQADAHRLWHKVLAPGAREVLLSWRRRLGARLRRWEQGGPDLIRGPRPPVDQLVLGGCQRPGERSSRSRATDAGWPAADSQWKHGEWEQRLEQLTNRRWRDFSWLTARALLDSANDQIAKLIHDLVNARRARWLASQRAAGVLDDFRDLLIQRPEATSCIILGDPGEADGSQYAVVEPMLRVDQRLDSEFMVVLSDVIYPAGDVNDYVNAFYRAYSRYKKPILALPGNHDWYDGLNGFMYHFCGAEALPPTAFRRTSYSAPERIASLLWRRADRPDRPLLQGHRFERAERWKPQQPGPYWAMDMGPVRLIAIDTGIKGTLDREQGEWLLRMSETDDDRPKVLLTGKPLWVDGARRPTPIEWGDVPGPGRDFQDVDEIVRHPGFNYVAAIGGDVHNYQRLTVTLRDTQPDGSNTTRSIEYVVAGGSGAYMSATHLIGRVAKAAEPESAPASSNGPEAEAAQPVAQRRPTTGAVADTDFRCYPTRGDSLAYYSRWFGQRIVGTFRIAGAVFAAAIAAIMAWLLAGGVEHGLGWVILAAAGGVLLLPGALMGTAFVSHQIFPRGYRTVGVLLVSPAVLVLALGALAWALGDAWEWVWEVMVIALGVALLPVVLVLMGYYGFSSSEGRLKRDLAACAIAVVVAGLWLDRVVTLPGLALTIATGLLCTAILLFAVATARRRLKDARPDDAGSLATFLYRSRRDARRWVPLTVLGYSLVPALLLAYFWDAGDGEARMAVVAFLTLVAGASGLALLLILSGGRWAFLDLREGPLDPDKALSYLHYLGIVETLPDGREPARQARIVGFDYRTARICNMLLPTARGPRKLLTSRVTEIGNADTPPMFKSFVTLEISDGDLVLTCYGVTGWDEHETDVPREDCVRIPLAAVRTPVAAAPAPATA
jgi:hypothetical protein